VGKGAIVTVDQRTVATEPPVFEESIGGALIDAARINVMAALHVLPPPQALDKIVLPGEDHPNAHDCLKRAMELLNAARALTVAQSQATPTSLHVVSTGGST
jgi:hypothetical protein